MLREKDIAKLSAAPNDDIELVENYFNDKCNCYSYAVQDYLAGHLSRDNNNDFNYLPRPGQSRGVTYTDLMGTNIKGMRRAICEDGLTFAGETYPKRIPQDTYVICCFLEPNEYHFIRQNKDGSWSSKNGRNLPTKTDVYGLPLTDPENYYHKDPNYKFVGYFYVPKGGIRVGVRAYEQKKSKILTKHAKPHETEQAQILSELSALSWLGNLTAKKMQKTFQRKERPSFAELEAIWDNYSTAFNVASYKYAKIQYSRRDILTEKRTRTKHKKASRLTACQNKSHLRD